MRCSDLKRIFYFPTFTDCLQSLFGEVIGVWDGDVNEILLVGEITIL